MEYRVLGPLEVLDGARAVTLGGPKQRLVLANLLARLNQVVPAERLIDEIWGDEPPDAARNALQSYVSRLRTALGKGRLEGRGGGYILRAEPEEVDASRFEALLREGRTLLRSDPGAAATRLEEALRLWRGPALADLADEPSLRGEIARLEELRMAATEQRITAELALGWHTTIVGRLDVLTGQHPLRERLWEQLMLALYRSGRQGEALASYHRARTELVEGLGIEPSPELRRLYEQILNQDPALARPGAKAPIPRPAALDELAPGTEFAGYRIDSLLARGGMSVVYLAQHLGLGRNVALKLLASRLAEDARFRERFVRESQIAASLDHPNVIPIYEAGELGGQLFIAMRYVVGTDLRLLLRERTALEDNEALSIIEQVAGALDAAHAEGLVHRDVKPANVLISQPRGSAGGEHVYLADFGLTKRTSPEGGIATTGHFEGTLDYAAPEQFHGQPLDARTDVYSLGCVLYECLVGHPPFRADADAIVMYAHLTQAPPSVTVERPDLPSNINEVVATALAKKPADRYTSCRELAEAAAAGLGLAPEGFSAEGRRNTWRLRRVQRRLGRRRVAIGVIAGLLITAIVAGLLQVVGGVAARASFQPGIAVIDAKTGEKLASIPPSAVRAPLEAIYAEGHFWVLNLDPPSFVEIDPRSGRILRRIPSPFGNGELGYYAVHGNTLWVTKDATVAKVDIRLGVEVDRFNLSAALPNAYQTVGIAEASESLWVGMGDMQVVLRLDPDTGKLQHQFGNLPGSWAVAFGDGSVWTAGNDRVNRIDPHTNTVTTTKVTGLFGYVAAGGGFGWTAEPTKGIVYKIDGVGQVTGAYRTGLGARTLAYSDGVLWAGNSDAGTVIGIDAVTNARRTFRFDHPVLGIAAGSGTLLVELAYGRSYEDRIAALEGRVARFFIPPYQLDVPDPAIAHNPVAFWVETATCAKLLNYPDAPYPQGSELMPEVAAAMPEVSRDGRTYTFTIRPGYRFSPPSNELLTAETFRYSIERALSPNLRGSAGPDFISDIEGEDRFRAGRAEHISGLRADRNLLTITLTRPSPDFLQRLALPYFCPYPTKTSVGGGPASDIYFPREASRVLPSAGPYYLADFLAGEYAILKRNPNYDGPRPHVFDAIGLREGVDPSVALGHVQDGSWDGLMHLNDPVLTPQGPVARHYGAGGSTADESTARYYDTPLPATNFFAFNASKAPFSDQVVRRAASLALDREALAAVWGQLPAHQLLPPALRGLDDRKPDAHGGSNLEEARFLMRGRTETALFAVYDDCDACRQEAEVVRANLSQIGINLKIKEFPDVFTAARNPDTAIDLMSVRSGVDYPDPGSFLAGILLRDMPRTWLSEGASRRLKRLSVLIGPARQSAAVALADYLASDEVPAAAFSTPATPSVLAPRMGCRVFPPYGFGVDLAALCARARG